MSNKVVQQPVKRQNSTTTINADLYYKIKLIALRLSSPGNKVNYNELMEEGMLSIIQKYNHLLPEEYQLKEGRD